MNSHKTFDIQTETKNSSTLKLLREITRWDEKAHADELNVIAKEIRNRLKLRQIAVRLFSICLIEANFGAAFSEDYYLFDEDEKEVRRQLRVGLEIHLTALFILSAIYWFFSSKILLLLFLLYFLWTAKSAFDIFSGPFKRIKKSAPNSSLA